MPSDLARWINNEMRDMDFPCGHCGLAFADHGLGRLRTCFQALSQRAPSPVAAEDAVALVIRKCGECPFISHSGAFTPGGAQDICDHRDAPSTFAATDTGNDHYHWKHRKVDRQSAPPLQCPIRATTKEPHGQP